MATIDRYYFRVCTDGARAQGVDVAALLTGAGIDPAMLDTSGWRGSVGSMARLVQAIQDALDDEYMGYAERAMPRGAFGFACEVAVDAATVGEGLRCAARFYTLANPGIATRIDEADGAVSVTVAFADPGRDPTQYFSEFWMIIWHRLACWLAGETVPLLDASFDYPRPDGYYEEFRHLFPCPHRFDADVRRIRMDARALHGPVRRTKSELADMVARAPLDMMTIPASDHSLARRVRMLLGHDPALAAAGVARQLGISDDSLRRGLRREGQPLSAIREAVRRDAAIRALTTTSRSVEAIAADLGYAEARSFTRAFRAWTGASPSVWRTRHGHG